jgi:hypothetical protein
VIDAGIIAVLAPFLMVVGIVWVKSRTQLEEKRIAAGQAHGPSDESRHVAGRVEELEERVRILERIVTDGGYDLAQKIEALRDERPIDRNIAATRSRETI